MESKLSFSLESFLVYIKENLRFQILSSFLSPSPENRSEKPTVKIETLPVKPAVRKKMHQSN